MISNSIKTPELFQIETEPSSEISHGFNQEWYRRKWQRAGGCGPTTASGLIYYLRNSSPDHGGVRIAKKQSSALNLMEAVWDYVTPSLQGVHLTKTFYEGVVAYGEANGLDVRYRFLDIPKKRGNRPDFIEVLSFIDESLSQDLPVAFLNLHNGSEKQLYSWHWVTLTSMSHAEDGITATATMLDDGKETRIDLSLWYSTTNNGGGFVSLYLV